MTTITNGKWAIEWYTIVQNGRELIRYRLTYDDKVIVEDVPDPDDLVNLFAISVIEAGFASIAKTYHDKQLYVDDADLDIYGPACSALAANDVLAFCRGDFSKMFMSDGVCGNLGMPNGSTFEQGVEQFRIGYQEHTVLAAKHEIRGDEPNISRS